MTRNSTFKKLKFKSVWLLAIICLLCFSLFFITACGDKPEEESDDTTYTKTETDAGDITNSTFEFGSAELSLEDYPQTSPTGWTKAVDYSAKSVSVKSGIVRTDSDEAWTEVLKNLYDSSDFLTYAKDKFGFDNATIDQIKETVKGENTDLSDDEIDEKVKEKIISDYIANSNNSGAFVNPAAKDGKKIYMLNSYTSGIYGSAQKLTSSSTVSLDKASIYKISVWVYTHNLSYADTSKGGANIRLINKFNGTTQAPFGIYGIDTGSTWKEYSLYVRTDADYDCTVQLVLGLGLGNGATVLAEDYTEGTVYFDSISIAKIEESDIPSGITETPFTYKTSTTDKNYVKATEESFIYDMRLSSNPGISTYLTNGSLSSLASAHGFTTNNGKTSADILGDTNSSKGTLNIVADELTLSDVKNASVTLTSSDIPVAAESYRYLTFKIDNQLKKFDKNGITVYVYDVNGSYENVTSVSTYSVVGDESRCSIVLKNEFDYNRTAKLKIVVGPTSIKDIKNADDFSSGSVTISDYMTATGSVYEYVDNNPINNVKTPNYDYYSLFSSTATSTVTLSAGETEVPSEDSDPTYNFTVASSEINSIRSTTTKVKNYKGVVADSQYIKAESNNAAVDERSGYNGDLNGNAGLINTKYLDSYSPLNIITASGSTVPSTDANAIKTALNYNGSDPIQPLMIYNKNASAYGYIGNSVSVSASSYAKISVKVRAVDGAVAYVYLVDVSGENKTVMTHDEFKVNTALDVNNPVGTTIENKQLFLKVDSSMMDNDGWCTVSFYIATGASSKTFRLEMWNGSRAGDDDSTGFVFFNLPDSAITTSSAFSEPDSYSDIFTTGVLSGLRDEVTESAMHQRELDATEIQYNSEQKSSDSKVSYSPKYIWIKGDTFAYTVFNTIDPVAVDPYADETEDETAKSGCTAETDPSTFWLSFSSIVLGVTLVLAIVMLFFKNYRRRHKARAKDAKSHYNVTSRYKTKKTEKKVAKPSFDDYEEESKVADKTEITETDNEISSETDVADENEDEYVYGEVQDFGDSAENTEAEESDSEDSEKSDD